MVDPLANGRLGRPRSVGATLARRTHVAGELHAAFSEQNIGQCAGSTHAHGCGDSSKVASRKTHALAPRRAPGTANWTERWCMVRSGTDQAEPFLIVRNVRWRRIKEEAGEVCEAAAGERESNWRSTSTACWCARAR